MAAIHKHEALVEALDMRQDPQGLKNLADEAAGF
jgi:hypothetical protein